MEIRNRIALLAFTTLIASAISGCGESSSSQTTSTVTPTSSSTPGETTQPSTTDAPTVTEPQPTVSTSPNDPATQQDETFTTCVNRLSLGEIPASFGEVTTESEPEVLRATVGYLALQVFDSESNPLLSVSFASEHPMANATSTPAATGLTATIGTFEEGLVVVLSQSTDDPCLPVSLIAYRLTEAEMRQLALTTVINAAE